MLAFLRKWLRPRLGGLPVFVLLALIQSCPRASITIGPGGTHSTTDHGVPTVVRRESTNGVEQVQVFWAAAVPMGLATYSASMAIAALIAGAVRTRRVRRILGGLPFAVVLVAFGISTGWSKYYWGYFLERPNIFRDLHLAQVSAASRVRTEDTGELRSRDGEVPLGSCDDDLDTTWCVAARLVAASPGGGTASPVDEEVLRQVKLEVESSGLLVEGEPGYDHARRLVGVVAQGRNTHGRDLVIAYLGAGEISNDHHPAYQFIFSQSAEGLRVVASARHFYDVAGAEGFEWYVAFPLLVMPPGVLALIVTGAIAKSDGPPPPRPRRRPY